MPKVERDRSQKDKSKREPRLARPLPQSFFDALESKRQEGKPHLFTDKEVSAIVRFVSTRPTHPDPSRAPAGVDFNEIERQFALDDQHKARLRAERRKTLSERIEKPSLASRLAAIPTPAEYIAPKPVQLEFSKLSVDNLVGIFTPKLAATLLRLTPIQERERLWAQVSRTDQLTFQALYTKLSYLNETLRPWLSNATHQERQKLDWALKSIENISFKGLAQTYHKVLARLLDVFEDHLRALD